MSNVCYYKYMKKVLRIYVRSCLLVLPVFFLPWIVNSFNTGKYYFLMISSLLALLLWVIDLLVSKKKVIKLNKNLWLFGGLVFWSFISWLRLGTGVRARSFSQSFGLGMWLALFNWFFVWLQVADRKEIAKDLNYFNISAVLMILSSLVVFVWPESKLPFIWPKDNPLISIGTTWSLAGSVLSELIFLVLLLLWNGRSLVRKLKRSNDQSYVFEAVKMAVLALGTFLAIYRLKKLGLITMDWRSSWVIMVESFKNSPLFGVGIGNFSTAFSIFRPASFNLTKVWLNNFILSRSALLHLWTEVGIVVPIVFFVFWGWLIKKKRKNFDFYLLVLLSLLLTVLPLNVFVLWLFFYILGSGRVWKGNSSKASLLLGESRINIMPWLLSLVVLVVGFGGVYLTSKCFLSEFYLKKSLIAMSKNDGSGSYNWQIKAIAMNPKLASLRAIYSQTNMGLARALLTKEKDLNQQDKEKLSMLMQQAVREAKTAINLESKKSDYWYNLARIYREMSGSVKGAADWALDAYSQAVLLDPINPNLKLDLGGLLFAGGKYEEAERVFEEAVVKKRDLANSWYNWAHTAKKLNKLEEAVGRMNQALALVPTDSEDYKKADKELAEWRRELETLRVKQKEQTEKAKVEKEKKEEVLTTPAPLPTISENQVEVKEDEMKPPVEETEGE